MTDTTTLEKRFAEIMGEKISSNGVESTIQELGQLITGLSNSLGPKELVLINKCGTITINNQQLING